MSDKNIDKDIEIVKEHIKELDEEKVLYGGFLSRKEAIENVLSELETYKKIAEKLAELILKEDINILNDICDKVPSKQCDNVEEGYCDKCIIDWARKEVENGN